MKKEIYVTGAGIVSALGLGKDANLRALINQQSGVQPIQFLETAHRDLPSGEVKHSNDALCEQLGIPPTEAFIRSSLLAIPAVKEALEQARIGELAPTARVALLSGITVGGMDKAEQYYDDFLLNDSRNAYIELNDCGACTEQIADFFGSRFTLVSTIVTACSSSANALMQGAELLRSGRADVVKSRSCPSPPSIASRTEPPTRYSRCPAASKREPRSPITCEMRSSSETALRWAWVRSGTGEESTREREWGVSKPVNDAARLTG